jgi:hypothetical protein
MVSDKNLINVALITHWFLVARHTTGCMHGMQSSKQMDEDKLQKIHRAL